MVKRDKANYMIQSVSHAIDVLEELARAHDEVGVTDLSKRLKLHKNNVFRLLATLELRGLVEQNRDSENYRLGVKALHLGQAYSAQNSLVKRAMPILRSLVDKCGESASLVILQNGYVQFPISLEPKRPVRVAPRIAVSFPAKQSAVGRLLIAQMSDAILQELLAANTPHDAAIRTQLHELRSSGQIIDRGAIEADVVAISKVIRGMNGEVVGAFEIVAPQYRAKTDTLLPALDEAAQTLSLQLGSIASSKLQASIERETSSKGAAADNSRPASMAGVVPSSSHRE